MTPYVIFDPTTGRIKMVGLASELPPVPPTLDPATSSVNVCELGVSGLTHYWNGNLGGVQPKQTLNPVITYPAPMACTLAGLPRPCTVRVENVDYTVTDGSAELVFGGPGTYAVIIESVPFLRWQQAIAVDYGRASAMGVATAGAIGAGGQSVAHAAGVATVNWPVKMKFDVWGLSITFAVKG